MNGDQLRMARALLRLTVRELAEMAGADKMAIVRMEAGRKPHAATAAKLKEALEARGIVFIGAVDPFHEPTIAMRFGMKPPVADDDEGEIDEGENGEANMAINSDRLALMRDFWANEIRWQKLQPASRKALMKALRI